jgi:SulP family sulfate permease
MAAAAPTPSFAELYTPKLITVLRERYGLADLRADAVAGLTVAVLALPLSMAIAIASGVTPDRGLYTAIVGGFLVSALGGSRFQIGGPAGAFIVLVAATAEIHGVDGLILAVLLSGLMLTAAGLLRLGTFIKYIPYPVTVGFTAGIGVIIFASQIKDLLGLTLRGAEPSAVLPKLHALGAALPTVNPPALGLAVATIVIIAGIRRFRPQLPGLLIAVAAASIVAALLHLPVETIGTRFGGIPSTLPLPHLPAISLGKIAAVLPSALSFTLLGSIESLLSAVVADSMTGRRHRSNCELTAQGIANIASALFGGICVTGTIARTATNVRAGAHGPLAGMMHSGFLLSFMLVAAPLASYIPLATLAGVLATVAWNMVERHAIAILVRASRGDALVLAATFFLTLFRDLSTGILAGFSISALLFVHRMAHSVEIEGGFPPPEDDRSDMGEDRTPYDSSLAADPRVAVYRVSGAFFFGAAAAVAAVLDRIAEHPRAYVIDFAAVPLLDSTAAATVEGFVQKAHRRGVAVYITGARRAVRRMLMMHGVRRPQARFMADIQSALAVARSEAEPGREAA